MSDVDYFISHFRMEMVIDTMLFWEFRVRINEDNQSNSIVCEPQYY
jgi:hypothetical protein